MSSGKRGCSRRYTLLSRKPLDLSVESGKRLGRTYSLRVTAILEILESCPDTFGQTIHLSISLRGIPKILDGTEFR